jgi:hypothetical protein
MKTWLQRYRTYSTYPTYFTLLVLLVIAAPVAAQRPGERPTRDTVEQMSRIDTIRALDLQLIKGERNNTIREAIWRQAVEDFKTLQSVNNKMMADTWANSKLDYKYISEMVGQIAKKAERLKSSLALPEVEENKDAKSADTEIATAKDFRAQLLSLDSSVMRFVTNPIFQKTNVVEMKLANQASTDLEAIISLSKRLKKAGEKLRARE